MLAMLFRMQNLKVFWLERLHQETDFNEEKKGKEQGLPKNRVSRYLCGKTEEHKKLSRPIASSPNSQRLFNFYHRDMVEFLEIIHHVHWH